MAGLDTFSFTYTIFEDFGGDFSIAFYGLLAAFFSFLTFTFGILVFGLVLGGGFGFGLTFFAVLAIVFLVLFDGLGVSFFLAANFFGISSEKAGLVVIKKLIKLL